MASAQRAGAESMLLIEADSGRVLHSENATQPWYPASVTKLMTAYVTLKAVKAGRISLDTLITVSPDAVAQAPSKMGFKAGSQLTVDNALKMLMVKSANDIAVTLAEGVSGSVPAFAEEMNRAAARLGMMQTSYVNPNGLPADEQITSARDQAILARAIYRELPEYELYWRISAIKLGKRVMRNYNTLLDRYPGTDGMKTGFICASGFNVVVSAKRNNRRLIAVVFGAPSGGVRAVKAAQMLERGFQSNRFSWLTPTSGTVETLKAIDAPPPNLRDDICGKKRKRPAAESEDIDDEHTQATLPPGMDPNSPQAVMLSSLHTANTKPSALIGPLVPSMEPIEVFLGPTKGSVPDTQVAGPKPKKKSKPSATAAATPAKPAAAPVAAASPATTSAKPTLTTPSAPPVGKFTSTGTANPTAKPDTAAPASAAKKKATKSAAAPAAGSSKTTAAPTTKPKPKKSADPAQRPTAEATAKPAAKPAQPAATTR
ncbi:D-alanyl-D-alanine carboxypeptidase family protein [Pseudorhodoplanes sinuspersici]|uniref:Uncharacterized protein n=1 Tax=Pseudorhodoplanes sinuspersici TaxID=1235591 RepID=A0A1W6ZM41_9HYPH|nr:D-alanyl-D-alanine carboxypeptidase family protein [Pseudorhodoplanes sinuspersici]ARP98468.1 hypothetical protein CAK95_04710 [Pseudorhodoplanes sinuspersici]RKE66141.1 D-alanyl-D-alanine carboxypeptidase [Pseudorhodoplanes sinuspersici]